MNLNRAELSTVYDALTQAMTDVQEDIDSGLYIGEPDDLKDAKAYIERMDALQARIHAELFPKGASMKTFEVTLKRESYITYTVEADDIESAETKAWEELSSDDYHKKEDASWSLDSIEEQV